MSINHAGQSSLPHQKVGPETICRNAIKMLQEGMKKERLPTSLKLQILKLEANTTHTRCYEDDYFARYHDFSWHIEFVVLVSDQKGHCNIIDYQCGKLRKTAWSAMTEELFAYMEWYDPPYLMAKDLTITHAIHYKPFMFTDSLRAFDSRAI